MQAVIPAAGKGTRLRPLTAEKPKALVAVDGTPILTRCFEHLRDAGIEKFVVVVGYRAGDIIDYYGDSYAGVPIRYVHQRQQLGLAHALLQAEPCIEGDFLFVNGDNVFQAELSRVVDRHAEADGAATALVEQVSVAAAKRTGVFETENGAIVGMVEKPDEPPSTLVSAGCYAFSPEVFDACRLLRPSDRGEYELSDAVDVLLTAGATVEPIELDGWRINVNTPEDRRMAAERLS